MQQEMAVDLELVKKQKLLAWGAWPRACRLTRTSSAGARPSRWPRIAKALGDPIRLQLVDVLRKHAGKVCVCELVPLFDLSQPTVSHHLKVLRQPASSAPSAAGCGPTTTSTPRRWRSWRMAELTSSDEVREAVRERYARRRGRGPGRSEAVAAARALGGRSPARGPTRHNTNISPPLPQPPTAPPGCGNPTAVAHLGEGDMVLDLGSGGGTDVLISARRVGPAGKANGLDMTDEMLGLARAQPAEAGVENVEFLRGTIEEIPLPDDSVDVIISNCVINLSGDKPAVLREAARVLRPAAGSRSPTSSRTRTWTRRPAPTCSSGPAASQARSRRKSSTASSARGGLRGDELEETHRVHEHAGSAIIRARKPEKS